MLLPPQTCPQISAKISGLELRVWLLLLDKWPDSSMPCFWLGDELDDIWNSKNFDITSCKCIDFYFYFLNLFQSILSHHSKDLKQQTSVTVHTGGILLGRQQKVHTQDMRASGPRRSGLNTAWVPFLYFLFPPLEPGSVLYRIGSVLYKIGLVSTIYQEGGMFGCVFSHPSFPFQSLDFLPLSLFLGFF